MLAGGLGPDNVRAAIDAVRLWAVDACLVPQVRAGRQGSRARARVRFGGFFLVQFDEFSLGLFGTVRRALRARDADAGARRARGRAGARRRADPAFDAELEPPARDTTSAARRRSTLAAALRAARREAHRHLSSARTSATRARTRSTTPSARCCSRQRIGKRRIIAETGAGQHGVATATVCARFGLDVRRLHGRGGHAAPGAQRRRA